MFRLTAAIGWWLISVILLCLPGNDLPQATWLARLYPDIWVHIGLFAGLTWLFNRVMMQRFPGRSALPKMIWVAVLALLYGILMEWVQKEWIPGRSFEIKDMCMDAIGSLTGYVISRYEHLRVVKKIGPDRNRDLNQN